MKARSPVLALALAGASLWAPGCSGGGVHAPIRIELAPTLDCSQDSADIPNGFFTLEICPSAGGTCAMLTDPGGDHAGGSPILRIPRPIDQRFTVDARLDASMDYDVTVTGYSGGDTGTCAPYALGHALGVHFGQTDVDVRLYPLGGWSCAGTHDGHAAVPRAMHQAVLLPNGEVLLLGGIEGPRPGAVAFSMPSMPQSIVEVFDPRDARFHPVAMTDESGVPGFSRVMFEARYVGTTASGQYEIHTFGGFDISHAPGGGLGFDANANVSTVSALFGPLSTMVMGETAGFRSDAIIMYDPVARTATVTAHGTGNFTTTAATEGPTSIGVVRSIDTVTEAPVTGRPTYTLSAGWYVDGVSQGRMQADRLGASISTISSTNFLIWGGHVATSGGLSLDATENTRLAGEVVSSTGAPLGMVSAHNESLTPDDGRPSATAYHTATHIAGGTGSTAILFAGGLLLSGGPAPLGTGIAHRTLPEFSLTVAHFGPDGSLMGGSERVPGLATNTVLHTATPVDASATNVLIVGGASIPMMMTSSLFAENGTGIVSFNPGTGTGTGTYSWAALPPLVTARWGHTTTIIPHHGVLVVGGLSRVEGNLTVSESSEFLLWEDLVSMGRPTPMDCAIAMDAGMSMDAGGHDAGTMTDAGHDAHASVDTGTD